MSYDYLAERPRIFTEDGQVMFMRIRDEATKLLASSGAVLSGKLMVDSGDTWMMLACMDRLIELGEVLEIPNTACRAGQDRIFIRPYTGF